MLALASYPARWLMIAAFFALALLGSSSEAHARPKVRIWIINLGQDVMELGTASLQEEVPDESLTQSQSNKQQVKAGIIYSRFGLFWLDIVRWDARYCLYREDGINDITYEEMSREQIYELTQLPWSQLKMPKLYYFPPGLIIGLVLALGFVAAVLRNNDEF